MCDRPIPQQNLCNDLARLLDVLPDEAVIPWLTGFWDVLSREWTSIDVLRMEKFLLLVRRVLGKSLAWVHGGTGKKGEKRREELLALFIEWPFETSGDLKRVPVGLRLHVLDIWIDEAEKVGIVGEDATEKDVEFLTDVKGILEEMVKNTVKPIKSKAKESLADERLPKDESAEEDGSGDDEDKSDVEGNNNGHGWGGFDD